MSIVAALAGRRIDPPDTEVERFPTRNVERVAAQLKSEFEQWKVRWLVCSAAAGADLIALKTARDLGIACHIVVPSSITEFSRSSVEDRGIGWKREFEQCLAETPPSNLVLVSEQATPAYTFKAANERILSKAISLSASTSSQHPVCFVAWDGKPHGEDDFSAHFADRARTLGFVVVTIPTL